LAFTPGTRLGVYEVAAQIGEGGMGQVFRATDTRLKRQVAIKILPPSVAADAERLTRFQREAEVLASLNHPNIAAIYGLEEGGGMTALVMEFVEGEDLSQRIARGAIPIDDALPIAKQIAEALGAAHEQGIIHRDLKPANIKVRPDGTVKVLDFGLARVGESAAGSSPNMSMSPTIATPVDFALGRPAMTQMGMILGTAAYMAPEQAKGRAVDKRADIWAFGVVLYEMLSGTRLFAGESVSDVLAAVLTREPDWSALPASTPPGLLRLLRRCLEREPRRRLHDIADSHFDLEDAAQPPSHTGSGRPSGGASGRRLPMRWLAGAAALTLLGALAGGFAVRGLDRAPTPKPTYFAAALSLGDDLMQQASGVAISPDGTRIAFGGSQGRQPWLFLRSFDELQQRLIPGSKDGFAPFFSPDGQWLAFFTVSEGTRGAALTKIKIEGGAPIRITDTASSALAGFTAAGSWSESEQILFSGSSPTIQRVSASGGPAVAVTALDASRNEQSHVQPRWLPDGRGLLYVANVASGRQDVMVASGDSGKGRVLVEGGNSPRFAPSGHLLFVREKTLLAAPFDLQKLELTGEPFPVVEALDVAAYGNFRNARFDLSQTGTLAYLIDGASTRSGQLVFVDRQGNATAVFEETGMYLVPRLSPDGGHIVYAAIDAQSGQRNIWIGDLKRGTRTRLTFGMGASTDPIWTPDGQHVTYATQEQGSALFTSPTDGSREPTRLIGSKDPNRFLFPRIWLRDGSGLVFHAIKTSDDIGIWRKNSGAEEMLLATSIAELEPSLSPDERFMAYVSDESGRREVYIRAVSGAAHRVQVSSEGGDEPVWSPRGSELFYRRGAQMIAVPVFTASSVTLGKPSVLFEGRYDVDPFNGDATNYDVAGDGQRFVMVRPAADPARSLLQLNVVVNWYEELKRMAPLK
jgi:Tol biopolymer transport system component